MDILVKIKDSKEQRVLTAFLSKRGYLFQMIGDSEDALNNSEEDLASEDDDLRRIDAAITKGNYVDHRKVEILLNERRNTVFK